MTLELSSQYIFVGAALTLLCVVASLISRRFGAPILLVFLVLGMLAGEDGPGGILFYDVGLAFLAGNLALAVIILDGGLGTRRSTFRVSLAPAMSLASIGVLLTALVTGLATHWILDLTWQQSLLIGAIVGSTDAAAVFGLLRFAGMELKARTGATLEIESGTNDPMAIFLTVTMVHILSDPNASMGWTLFSSLILQMGLGSLLGLAGGSLMVVSLKRLPLPPSLVPLFVLAGGLSVFGVTNLVGGSGFLAIYMVGVLIGNAATPGKTDIRRFHDGMAWLSQIGMFLVLGLLITPSHMVPIILPAIAIALVLIFIARPLAVVVALAPFRFPWREQVFISWCGLRGAVPIILALFPYMAGVEQTRVFFELVFFVVLISLVLQGWTISPVARWLGINLPASLREPPYQQLALAGKNPTQRLCVFEVVKGCKALERDPNTLNLPKNSEFVGVLRDGIPVSTTRLELHDQVLIAAGDALQPFASAFTPLGKREAEHPTFGEFYLSPEAALKDVAELYGFTIPGPAVHCSLAQYLTQCYHGRVVVGDAVRFGKVQLMVAAMDNSRMTSVSLRLIH